MANPEYAKMLSFSKYFKIILSGLLLSLILSIIILSYVPPVSRDALTHHLAVPKLYLKHGSIYEIPDLECSYYPMNLDLLYLIPLSFGSDIIPKYIHYLFALMTAWIIFSYLGKRIDTCYALFGVLLFLSLPVIIKLSITVYVDLGLIFFSTASIIYLLKWIEKKFDVKCLIYSAIFCGLALGTKYNGLVLLFLLTLFVPFVYLRFFKNKTASQRKAISYSVIFMFISLIVFSPWMIRNYIWTNNPIYPLYDNLINHDKIISTKASIIDSDDSAIKTSNNIFKKSKENWGPFAVRKVIYKEKWWETALIPIRVFFQGKDENPKYFDGRLNPYLFILPFFAFIKKKKESLPLGTEKKILIAFSILLLLFVFTQKDVRIRYIGPIIPPLIILSVFGLHRIISAISDKYSGTTEKTLKGFVFTFMAFLLSLNAIYLLEQFKIIEPISYISGRVGRDEYIEKYRPEYAAINYANHNIPTDAKILCLFLGNRAYYFDREIAFSFDLVSKVVLQEGALDKILVDFERRRLTHLLVRYDLFNKWLNGNYSDMEKKVIKNFFNKYTNLIFSKNGHGLYRLKNHTFEDG